ncbi:hypothetical protein D1007_54157 [Hordeum vulgare]|nr:hypothetical protein D1007_54157 [Hordeum vulgare]
MTSRRHHRPAMAAAGAALRRLVHWTTTTCSARSSSASRRSRPPSPAPPSSASAGAVSFPTASSPAATTATAPPLLGFFDRHSLSFTPTLDAPNRLPPGRFSMQRGDGDRFISLGCRHGLLLIFDISRNKILVCDPLTGDQHRLDIPPGLATHAKQTIINGAVLRAGDLQQHFQVVLTVAGSAGKQLGRVLACVYSSETGVWGDLITTELPSEVLESSIFPPTLVNTRMPAVLAGGSLYWMLVGRFVGVLEFDLENQSLAVIRVPMHMLKEGNYAFSIMRAEGGGLGLLFRTGDHNLQLWKRKIDCDGLASWGLGRSIEPDKLLSLDSQGLRILGFAEENDVVFLWTSGVIFMVNLESLQFKKLFETSFLTPYHPFESV